MVQVVSITRVADDATIYSQGQLAELAKNLSKTDLLAKLGGCKSWNKARICAHYFAMQDIFENYEVTVKCSHCGSEITQKKTKHDLTHSLAEAQTCPKCNAMTVTWARDGWEQFGKLLCVMH